MKGLKPALVAILTIGLLAGSAVGVAAQEEEDPVGPPGSSYAWGISLNVEELNAEDPDSTKSADLFSYGNNGDEDFAFFFARDDDWCRSVVNVRLDVEDPEARLADCLQWVETTCCGSGGTVVFLPESWAVRIAKRMGWHPDDVE